MYQTKQGHFILGEKQWITENRGSHKNIRIFKKWNGCLRSRRLLLPVNYRIDYKVLLLTYKALNGIAPSYLLELLHPRKTRHSLIDQRIDFHCKYLLQRTKHTVANPSTFPNIRKCKTVGSFKTSLKTHLFLKAFPEAKDLKRS